MKLSQVFMIAVTVSFIFCDIVFTQIRAGRDTVKQVQEQMNYKKSLKEFSENMKKNMSPEAWDKGEKAGQDAITELNAKGAASRALGAGALVPSFSLKDAFGKSVSSSELFGKGAVVLVFYRGSWCPYCSLYLKTLQKWLVRIESQGAVVVGITAETPSRPMTFEKKELSFTVLSDPKLKVSEKFGVVYDVPAGLDEYYKGIGKNVAKENDMEQPAMIMSSIYIVNKAGRIIHAYVDVNPKTWPEPSEIVANLRQLNLNKKSSQSQ